MTEIADFQRCDRMYWYKAERGLTSRSSSFALAWGNLWHHGLCGLYRALQASGSAERRALTVAHGLIEQTQEIEHPHWGKLTTNLTPQERETMHDCLDYYWQELGSKDDFTQIVGVENSLIYPLRQPGKLIARVRCTMDLIARMADGRLVILDHKSTGKPDKSKEFVRLDFQARMYPLAVWDAYGELPEFILRFCARDVPPGFGRRPLTTKTGKKRDADTLVSLQQHEKYLTEYRKGYSAQELEAFEHELLNLAAARNWAKAGEIWNRRPIKGGVPNCVQHCDYNAICEAELDTGRTIPNSAGVIQIGFTTREQRQVALKSLEEIFE
jgi:hypothetical protein